MVWGSAHASHLKPLITLQKKALRIITNSPYNAESQPIFRALKLLTVPDIHKLNCLNFIFKCLNCNYLNYRHRIIHENFSHEYVTRFRHVLNPPFERLSLCKNSFLNKGIGLWNRLDERTKERKTLSSFKKAIKHLLIENNNAL